MKKIILISASILISVLVYSQSTTSKRNFEKGTEAIKFGNYQTGIKLLTMSIEEFPTSDAYFNRAAAYNILGDTCKFCSDLKIAFDMNDWEAQKLYIEKCSSGIIFKKVSESISAKNPIIKYLQIIDSKCNSDSTITFLYMKKGDEPSSIKIVESYSSQPYNYVEQMPSFPGGEEGLHRFLTKNIDYPVTVSNNNISGTVYVSYVIDENGYVTDVKVTEGIGSGYDEEAVRVVYMMPKWKPGKQNGKTVRVKSTSRIHFGPVK
jgi:TonB family protein